MASSTLGGGNSTGGNARFNALDYIKTTFGGLTTYADTLKKKAPTPFVNPVTPVARPKQRAAGFSIGTKILSGS
jgi:hypothetical protein